MCACVRHAPTTTLITYCSDLTYRNKKLRKTPHEIYSKQEKQSMTHAQRHWPTVKLYCTDAHYSVKLFCTALTEHHMIFQY